MLNYDLLNSRKTPLTVKVLINQIGNDTNYNTFIDDDENDDEYGEVPDRETIKKHTNQMLNARLKSKQSKKTKKKKVFLFFFFFPHCTLYMYILF